MILAVFRQIAFAHLSGDQTAWSVQGLHIGTAVPCLAYSQQPKFEGARSLTSMDDCTEALCHSESSLNELAIDKLQIAGFVRLNLSMEG